ncbi:divalent-cation tolerance protein CutA [Comamonas flocculans]|uniref:Divalent-cation tolerance protein CutA n=1 Tax=Comamonas flocculans TaxID=2597701 RepID=A0A5B8RT01_9BURK|nr:divalent-cation tolerance protein CutA [Comamonas flocculans]QEA11968.1 divalent-cation tolerance protein CutA [Comamonas flocculans]
MTGFETIAVVSTTVAQAQDAERLAALALQQRLAACVQVVQVQSHYRWKGALQREAEWRLDGKTAQAQVPALLALLRAHHPYELPELAVNLCQVSTAYADWVRAETGDAAQGAGQA